jgi:uncharacterized protein YciI
MTPPKLQFVYVLTPHKEDFVNTMTDEEAAIMKEHFYYLQDLLGRDILILAGPVTTGEFGLAVLETDSEENARNIMENDPAVKKNVMSVKLYPYRVSLLRGMTI